MEKLTYLLLAIEHASGYIFTEMISLYEYLPLLEANAKKVLNRYLPAFGVEYSYDLVFTTLETSFIAIEKMDPEAIKILTYYSFYEYVDIPTILFADEAVTQSKFPKRQLSALTT